MHLLSRGLLGLLILGLFLLLNSVNLTAPLAQAEVSQLPMIDHETECSDSDGDGECDDSTEQD